MLNEWEFAEEPASPIRQAQPCRRELRASFAGALLAWLTCSGVDVALAQDDSLIAEGRATPSVAAGRREPMPARVQATAAAGLSAMVFDAGGDGTFTGYGLRAGAVVAPMLDLTVGLEYWPALERYVAWSAQAEASFFPVGRRRVSPYLRLALGHFDAEDRQRPTVGLQGLAQAVGLGVQVRVWRRIGLGLEGTVRFDPGSRDSQLHGFMLYSPRPTRHLSGRPEASVLISGMVPVAGPWRFTEPGYGVSFATPIAEAQALTLSVLVVHWRITEPQRLLVPYLWDTRAAIFMVGWRTGLAAGPVAVQAGVGPAASVMLEGPDGGMRGGGQLQVTGTLEAGPVPFTVAAGWLWLSRVTKPLVAGTDQHGLILSAGLRF